MKTKTDKSSEIKVRSRIQELLEDNMRPSIGRFHSKELNESAFVSDLLKNFNITPKQ